MLSQDQQSARSPVYGIAHTRPYHRSEPREARSAITVAQQIDWQERSWFRVELIDSSRHGMGLESPIPVPPGIELTIHITVAGGSPELLRCCVRHCTKQKSGRYHIGATILERA